MPSPVIAIAMGDAAGIGPEIIVKMLQETETYALCRPFAIADPAVLEGTARMLGAPMTVRTVSSLEEAEYRPGILDVLPPPGLGRVEVAPGVVSPAGGRGAALCIETAMHLAMSGEIQGMVNAPMNKEAFHLAGYDYMDEMEYMADITGCTGAYSLGVMDRVWTVRVAEHVAFRNIPDLVTRERVVWFIGQLRAALLKVGQQRPRIAVAALNVHGGEGGLFGREEIDEIGPAVVEARAAGVDVTGPLPADSVFARALAGEFDGVVGMYHDQVNIARKLQPMGERATIFMGLPVPCGTTAHGSAFDIAGRGIADPSGLRCALRVTARLAG